MREPDDATVEALARVLDPAAWRPATFDTAGSVRRRDYAREQAALVLSSSVMDTVAAEAWDEGCNVFCQAMEQWYEPSSTERMYWPEPVNPYRANALDPTPTDRSTTDE